MLMSLFCTKILPLILIAIAIFVGWLRTFPIPEGVLFSMVYPITKGYIPPVISGGYGKTPVVEVPDDYKSALLDRPGNEMFVNLKGSNDKMPQQGIGMCCRYTAYDPESVRRTILWYLLLGGRHIDTADLYLNHQWIGEAITYAINNYDIKREDIFITTKIFPRTYGYNSTLKAIERFKRELNVDYIDLVLMHAPSLMKGMDLLGTKTKKENFSDCYKYKLNPKQCRLDTWKALSTAVQDGSVRNAGVSNFNTRQLDEIRVELTNNNHEDDHIVIAPIAVNQFQYNPWVSQFLHDTYNYCQKHDIAVMAWSSLAGTAMQSGMAFTVQTLREISKRHDKTVAQILLRWSIQKNCIIIPGTGNPKHMKENLNVYDFVLTQDEMNMIDELGNDEELKKLFITMPEDET